MASLSHLIKLIKENSQDIRSYLEGCSAKGLQNLLLERDSEDKTAVHFGAKFLSSEVCAVQKCNERSSNYMSLRH